MLTVLTVVFLLLGNLQKEGKRGWRFPFRVAHSKGCKQPSEPSVPSAGWYKALEENNLAVAASADRRGANALDADDCRAESSLSVGLSPSGSATKPASRQVTLLSLENDGPPPADDVAGSPDESFPDDMTFEI